MEESGGECNQFVSGFGVTVYGIRYVFPPSEAKKSPNEVIHLAIGDTVL